MAIFKKKKTCVHLKKNHVAKTKESTYILHYERKQSFIELEQLYSSLFERNRFI
jgi:hypothetical protein